MNYRTVLQICTAVLISFLLFAPLSLEAKEALSPKKTKELLGSIESLGMVYGDGDKKVYVFVDPKCPHSQDFISMISENTKMRSTYRYYIFFYELKRFNSHDLIGRIYESSAPLQRTFDVMVEKKEFPTDTRLEAKTEEKIDAISRVADEIGISKRPYLIIAKKLD